MTKILTILLAAFALSGCANMTPEQKRNTWIAVGAVVITGAVLASKDEVQQRRCHTFIVVGPGGSDHVTRCE